MLIAVCSDKGSPGATTTALAFASAWPTPAAMVEADPSGGDVALRLRTEHGSVLSETPTVLTLAAASRSTASDDLLERFTHRVNDQLSVVPGPLLAEQVGRVADWQTLAERLVEADRPVLVDLGRLHAGSPLLPVAAQADVVVLVARAETESLIRMRERAAHLVPALAALRDTPPRLFALVVGLQRHRTADLRDVRALLEDTTAGPILAGAGHLAYDVGGVQRLFTGQHPAGRLARTTLMRSAAQTAADLAALTASSAEAVR